MKKSKLDYSAPEAEVFVVRVERGLCQSPTGETVKTKINWDGLDDWTDNE